MDVFEAIARRHSYRGPFRDVVLPRPDLERIVQSGIQAPSAKNAQTTSFVIVDNPALTRLINARHTMPAMQTARAFILCLTHKNPQPVYEGYAFELEDCAAAVENMLLAITALGYASVWVAGWLRVNGNGQALARELQLPPEKVIQVILPVGVAEQVHPQREKKSFAQRACYGG